LQLTCTYANVSADQQCVVDHTTYIDIGPDGEHFSNTITRHNCEGTQLYCDPSSLRCAPTKGVGTPCASDEECQSVSGLATVDASHYIHGFVQFNCDASGACAIPPLHITKVYPWQFAVTITFLVIGELDHYTYTYCPSFQSLFLPHSYGCNRIFAHRYP